MLQAVLQTLEETLDSVKIVQDGIPVVTGPRLGLFITVNHSLVADNSITGRSPVLLPQHLQLLEKSKDIKKRKYHSLKHNLHSFKWPMLQ